MKPAMPARIAAGPREAASDAAANDGAVAPPGGLRLGTLALALGVCLFALQLLFASPRLNHDVAQYLSAGQLLLNGALPYRDIVDTNPPLIIYLSAIPAALAALTGLPLAVCGNVFLALLILLGYALAVETFRRAAPGFDGTGKNLVGMAWLFLCVLSYRNSHTLGLGQRDALIGAFLLPWVALRLARYEEARVKKGLAAGVGLLALLALGMKPMFALPLLMVEALLVIRYRRRPLLYEPEIVSAGTAGVIYALHFLIMPGQDSFYSEWLPFVAAGYEAYNVPFDAVMTTLFEGSTLWLGVPPVLIIAICLIVAIWGVRTRDATLRLAGCIATFALGAVLVYLAQHKGWRYHLLPFDLAAWTCAALVTAWAIRQAVLRTGQDVIGQVLATLLILASVSWSQPGLRTFLQDLSLHPRRPPNMLADTIEQYTAPDDRVLFLVTNVGLAYPALAYTERLPAGRFLCTYPLAFFFQHADSYDVPAGWARQEKNFYEGLLGDVRRQEPRLILVDTTYAPQAAPPFFQVSGYLRRRGFYEAIGPEYGQVGTVGGLQVLRRRDDPEVVSAGMN